MAPRPDLAILRYKARARERRTTDDREHQCELTKGQIEAEDETRKTRGSERRAARAMSRVWSPRDDDGPLLRGKMERRGALAQNI
jgi:hypothetical protein